MTSTASTIDVSGPAELAAFLHDDVLQSLGVAVLGLDLCRRLHQKLRYEAALAEIDGVGDAITLALASSLRALPALRRLVPSGAARPSLLLLNAASPAAAGRLPTPIHPTLVHAALAHPALARPAAGADEIVETLTACQVIIARCRNQYDAGLGEDTMRDLDVLEQRLLFVSVAFREIMNQLRQRAGQPLGPQPLAPLPYDAGAEQAAPVAWIRSA